MYCLCPWLCDYEQKALDELLPLEEGPKGRDPTSACLSEDFDALLDEANTR